MMDLPPRIKASIPTQLSFDIPSTVQASFCFLIFYIFVIDFCLPNSTKENKCNKEQNNLLEYPIIPIMKNIKIFYDFQYLPNI